MIFHCTSCTLDTLELLHSLTILPEDGFSDRAIQYLHCSVCDFSALGMYQERHLPSEEIDHFCYRIPTVSAAKKLQDLLSSCPHPNQKDCPCPAHALFSGTTVALTKKIDEEYHLDSVPLPLTIAGTLSDTDDLPDYLF